MYTNLWLKIIVLAILLKKSRSECVCRDNSQQEIICTQNGSQNQGYLLKMDSNVLEQDRIPFTNMETVTIHCGIRELQFNSLEKQATAKALDLSQNNITHIPHNFFRTMSILEKLDFSKNELKKLKVDTFNSLQQLRILNLSFNKISKMELGILDNLGNLETLYLNNNKIFSLPVGIFQEVVNIKYIHLSHNQLSRIEPYLLEANKLLKSIDFSQNPLEGKDSLKGLMNLHQIQNAKLESCNLKNTELQYINTCIHLKEVDLSNNGLYEIPENTFSTMKALEILHLRGCNLSDLAVNMFEHNAKLLRLDLSYNGFKTLRNGLLLNTTLLGHLNISHNQITDLPVELFQVADLVEIDLSYNELDTIKPDMLNMETLTHVHAQNNRITHLEDLTFATCNFPILYINLMHNRLVFLGEYFFDWLANLEKIEIFGNPWDCKCFEELTALLSDRFIDYDYSVYSNGTVPICVSGDPKVCNYDDTNLTHYYEIYKSYITDVKM